MKLALFLLGAIAIPGSGSGIDVGPGIPSFREFIIVDGSGDTITWMKTFGPGSNLLYEPSRELAELLLQRPVGRELVLLSSEHGFVTFGKAASLKRYAADPQFVKNETLRSAIAQVPAGRDARILAMYDPDRKLNRLELELAPAGKLKRADRAGERHICQIVYLRGGEAGKSLRTEGCEWPKCALLVKPPLQSSADSEQEFLYDEAGNLVNPGASP